MILIHAIFAIEKKPAVMLAYGKETSSSSKRNTSSIVLSRARLISFANLSEGLYFPFSKKTIVSLLTQIFSANAD
jgi:hypothetical protein